MKARRWLGWALFLSLGLLLGPPLLLLLSFLPRLIWRAPCRAMIDCTGIVDTADKLQLLLLIVGPLLMLLGTAVLLGLAASRIVRRDVVSRTVGSLALLTILAIAWIPAGPDACSRRFSDTAYATCLEDIFDGLTIAETRDWLGTSGYRLTDIQETRHPEPPRAEQPRTLADTPHDYYVAYRDKGHYYSAPYGTNFHRLFLLAGPGSARFRLIIYVDTATDRVIAVDARWAFSFF